MKKVMVFGTFDIFHPGHEYFLREAKKLGDNLIVVVARDETVFRVKKNLPLNDEKKRVEKIIESGLANSVFLGGKGDKYEVVKKNKPDVICLGYDQKFFTKNLKDKLKEFGLQKTEVVRVDSFLPEIYKSSKLRSLEIDF